MLAEYGLEISSTHGYHSTDDDYAPSTESLKYVVFHLSEMPENRKIANISAWSRGTEVYLDDGTEYLGNIWYAETESDVIKYAIADIQEKRDQQMIKKAFEWIAQNNPDYLAGIVSRKTGSQWNGDFDWREAAIAYWQRAYHLNPLIIKEGCDYFYIDFGRYVAPDFLKGKEKIRLLSDFSRKELKLIEIVEDVHGIELQSSLVKEKSADKCWLIIGDAYIDGEKVEGEKMPWACYPGDLTASIKHIPESLEWDGTILDLWAISKEEKIPFAVKGI